MVLYAVHDAMVKPMPAGVSTPSLAESWSESKDHLSYTFTLRRNARFHNGEPVTAEDVKFSFERYKGASATLLKEKVKEVQALSANQVRFVLKEPWPDFMTFYGTTASGAAWIVPKKYVEKVGEDGFKAAPVGAGPYRVISFKPGVELVLEAFDGYWRKVPSVKRLVMRSLPEETTRAAALRNGEVDIVYLLAGPTAEALQKAPGYKIVAPLLSGAFWLGLFAALGTGALSNLSHPQRIAPLFGLAVAVEAMGVRKQENTIGFSAVAHLAAAVLFGPVVAACIAATEVVLVDGVRSRHLTYILMNSAMFGTAAWHAPRPTHARQPPTPPAQPPTRPTAPAPRSPQTAATTSVSQ